MTEEKKPKGPTGKRYPEEFKREAVRRLVEDGERAKDVAKALTVPVGTLHAWKNKYAPEFISRHRTRAGKKWERKRQRAPGRGRKRKPPRKVMRVPVAFEDDVRELIAQLEGESPGEKITLSDRARAAGYYKGKDGALRRTIEGAKKQRAALERSMELCARVMDVAIETGATSGAELASELNERSMTTPRGEKWTASRVCSLLREHGITTRGW